MNEKFVSLVEQVIEDLGYGDTFLVELKVNNKKIEVYLDSDESVTFEKCRKISRKMEETLDEEKWLGESYQLDVSSAGVGRPLVQTRQYKKNVGRQIEVSVKEGDKVKGTLVDADDDKIIVEYKKTVKQGKKKIKTVESTEINYDAIDQAKIRVSF